LRRDLYDLSRERSRAAALEAELKCLKATTGPPTVAYEVVEVPVQLDDMPPPEVNTVVQMSPSRSDNLVVQGLAANMTRRQPPVSAAMVYTPDVADALIRHPHAAADTRTVYACHSTSASTLQPSYMPSSVRAPNMYCSGPELIQPQQYLASDPVFTQYQSHTQPRMPATSAIAEQAYTHTPFHTFSCSLLEPANTQSTVTSVLPRQPTAPGDFAFIDDTVQRDVDRVDSSNAYTHDIEQLLADLPPPPHVHRQLLPLSSVRTQTTASAYVNTDTTPSLLAQRYVDTPLYVNTSSYGNAPLLQLIEHGQSNVTHASALYTQSYTSDLNSSGLVALDQNIARSSYTDNSQRLPIAVDQPGFSAFSRVDVTHSRPVTVDSRVQYAVCTSATTSTALLQSPSIHWRKWLSSDYIQPDTGPGATTHAVPATQSVYMGPQTSDTHTYIQLVCTCKTCHLVQVIVQ